MSKHSSFQYESLGDTLLRGIEHCASDVFLIDPRRRVVTFANASARRNLALADDAAVARLELSKLFHFEAGADAKWQALLSGDAHAAGRTMRAHARMQRGDSSEHVLDVVANVVAGADGAPAILVMGMDLTPQRPTQLDRDAEREVRDQRHQLFIAASRDGICDYDFDYDSPSGRLFVSAQAAYLLGYDEAAQARSARDSAALQEFLWARLHPDDRDRVAHAARVCWQDSTQLLDIEARCLNGAGVYRWLHVRGQVTRSTQMLLRFTASLYDVTQRKISEAMLQDTVSRLAAVLQHVADGVITLDGEGGIRSMNPAAERIFDIAEGEVLGRNIALLVPYTNEDGLPLDAVFQQVASDSACVGNRRNGAQFPLEILVTRMVVANAPMYTALVRDISERRRTEIQMREARDTAEAGLRAKSEFLAMMSHEMRTPLNGVLGLTQLLLDSSLSAEQEETLYAIERSGTALLAIINDLLDFSKIEAGRMALETAPFDLVQLLRETVELVAPTACEKGIELIIDYPDKVPRWFVGDATRVRQILLNLCGNAVKFTARGHVAISVRQAQDTHDATRGEGDLVAQLSIAIEDTGIGIARLAQERLFEPFTQMDLSTTRLFGGTGLGLAIARQLAELMGGCIRVTSELDVGSEFVLDVALRIATNEHAMGLRAAAARPADSGRRSARLLVPHPRSSVVLARDITACGFAVQQVATLDALLVEDAVDLLVLDSAVFDDGGTHENVVGECVSDVEYIVRLLTGAASLERTLLLLPAGKSVDRARMKSLGFGSIATKPLHADELRAAIEAWSANALTTVRAVSVAERDGIDVLVAEDNVINQRVAQRMLEQLGCRVQLVGDGRAAVTAWRTQHFAMIFMDVRMPHMDGLAATMAIREEEARRGLSPIPIVAMTANAEASDERRCRDIGMSDFVAKPVAVSQLQLVLQQWLPGDAQAGNGLPTSV